MSAAWLAGAGTQTEIEVPVSARVTGDEVSDSAKQVEDAQALQTRVARQASDVRNRLHMAAVVSVGDDPGEEAEIAELYRSGWIIDATVDEVEAALQAAAATPSTADDVEAKELAHRASCRFFLSR